MAQLKIVVVGDGDNTETKVTLDDKDITLLVEFNVTGEVGSLPRVGLRLASPVETGIKPMTAECDLERVTVTAEVYDDFAEELLRVNADRETAFRESAKVEEGSDV